MATLSGAPVKERLAEKRAVLFFSSVAYFVRLCRFALVAPSVAPRPSALELGLPFTSWSGNGVGHFATLQEKLMNLLPRFAILFVLLFLGACASQVVEPDAASRPRPVVKALESFSVELSPKAKEQLAEDVKFDLNALTRNLEVALKSKGLIATDGDFRLKVVVTDVRVRGTFNAVMWGFMAGDDHLNGESILLRKEGDDAVYEFKVKTSYAFGGLAGGQDAMRMDWLYDAFSKKVADKLVALREEKAGTRGDVEPPKVSAQATAPAVAVTPTGTAVVATLPATATQSGEVLTFQRVGDKWRYTLTGIGATKGIVTIEVVETRARRVRERITREGYPQFVAERDVEAGFDPSRFQTEVVLPGGYQLWEIAPYFPPGTELQVGKTFGPIAGEFHITGSGKMSLVFQAQIAGKEKVRVPAGEFTAWRVETVSETGLGLAPAQVTCTYWYTPELRRTVKMQTNTKWRITADLKREPDQEVYELLAFDPVN